MPLDDEDKDLFRLTNIVKYASHTGIDMANKGEGRGVIEEAYESSDDELFDRECKDSSKVSSTSKNDNEASEEDLGELFRLTSIVNYNSHAGVDDAKDGEGHGDLDNSFESRDDEIFDGKFSAKTKHVEAALDGDEGALFRLTNVINYVNEVKEHEDNGNVKGGSDDESIGSEFEYIDNANSSSDDEEKEESVHQDQDKPSERNLANFSSFSEKFITADFLKTSHNPKLLNKMSSIEIPLEDEEGSLPHEYSNKTHESDTSAKDGNSMESKHEGEKEGNDTGFEHGH